MVAVAVKNLKLVSVEDDVVTFTVGTGECKVTRKFKEDGFFSFNGGEYQMTGDEIVTLGTSSNGAVRTSNPFRQIQSEFPINQRFDFLRKFTNMVLDKTLPSAIVSGEGGLGKSHTVTDALRAKRMREGDDYVIIKGFVTPKALYATLFEQNGKVIIFDDCDSVLKDPVSINLLKGALDSYAVRTISWLSKGFIDDGYPDSFEFTGQVIFISNINSANMDQAIKSRSITIDLSMTIQDKIERMQHILPTILPEYALDVKEAALAFMAEHSNEAREFNLRTLQKSIKVIAAYGLENADDWHSAVKYLLVSI